MSGNDSSGLSGGVKVLIGIVILIIIIGAGFVVKYNSIVAQHQTVLGKWGDVESTIQRRMDLIPNLVNTVKGYAKHEKTTLAEVQKLRSLSYQTKVDISNESQMKQLAKQQANLTGALSKLMAVSEKYPDLKASQNFMALQSQLEGTENRINVARIRYNESVQTYNSTILAFFGRIVNNIMLNYKEAIYYKADIAAQKAPTVNF